MVDYRKKLTLGNSSGSRVIILQCNKSEKKSFVKHHQADGGAAWAKEKVVTWHADNKTPKILHITVVSEEIYEVIGQPVVSGLYAFYTDLKGGVWYSPISPADRAALIASKKAGKSYRDSLAGLGKHVF